LNNIASHSDLSSYPASPKRVFAGILIFLLSGLHLSGQVPPKEYQVKAIFLYNFTQFVEWPASAFRYAAEPFVIGVLGDNPFGLYLEETVAGEQVMGHPLVIQHYTDVKDIGSCHILFITSSEPKKMKTALSGMVNRSILTVSDMNNFAGLGGMIGFVNYDNRIKLQIKPAAAKEAGLNISSKLLRLADIIE